MLNKMIKAALITATPFLLAACNSTTSTTSTVATPSASAGGTNLVASTAATMAASSNLATTVAGVTSAQVLAVAGGGLDASGQGGPFPTTISGGDGFQANPVEDASFASLINGVRTV